MARRPVGVKLSDKEFEEILVKADQRATVAAVEAKLAFTNDNNSDEQHLCGGDNWVAMSVNEPLAKYCKRMAIGRAGEEWYRGRKTLEIRMCRTKIGQLRCVRKAAARAYHDVLAQHGVVSWVQSIEEA